MNFFLITAALVAIAVAAPVNYNDQPLPPITQLHANPVTNYDHHAMLAPLRIPGQDPQHHLPQAPPQPQGPPPANRHALDAGPHDPPLRQHGHPQWPPSINAPQQHQGTNRQHYNPPPAFPQAPAQHLPRTLPQLQVEPPPEEAPHYDPTRNQLQKKHDTAAEAYRRSYHANDRAANIKGAPAVFGQERDRARVNYHKHIRGSNEPIAVWELKQELDQANESLRLAKKFIIDSEQTSGQGNRRRGA